MRMFTPPLLFYSYAFATAAIVSGCASGFPGARPLTYATPGEARIFASAGKCPHEPKGDEAAGLAAALISGIASQLLINFGTALQKGAEGGNLPSSVSTLNMLLSPGTVPRCIVVIRGAFDKDERNSEEVKLKSLFAAESDLDRQERLRGFNFVPLYRVDHLIEIQVMSSSNSKAFTFAPIFVRLDQSIDGAKKGERDVSIALKFNRAGAEGSGSAVVVADRMIGQAPTEQQRDILTGRFPREAPWFGTFYATTASAETATAAKPAAPAASAPAVVGGGGAGLAGVAPVAGGKPVANVTTLFSKDVNAVPVTVTATVVETRPTNEGLAFIAAVFGGIKPKIEDALKPIVDPSLAEAAEQTAASTALASEAEYSLAFRAAELAVITYCNNASKEPTPVGQADRLTKSSDARIAQLKANASAIKLGKPDVPYASIITTSAALPSAANGCP